MYVCEMLWVKPPIVPITVAFALLTAGIDDLREKREEITKQLREDEAEKTKIQTEVGDYYVIDDLA